MADRDFGMRTYKPFGCPNQVLIQMECPTFIKLHKNAERRPKPKIHERYQNKENAISKLSTLKLEMFFPTKKSF